MNQDTTKSIGPLALRWLNVQCYEIKLPNGKVILTDPQFSDPRPDDDKAKYYKIPVSFGITKECIERVDYLIVNHTHCDHLIDLGYFVRKFQPIVICHQAVAYELAKAFDIPFTLMYPVGTQEHHVFEDFRLDTLNGSHMPQAFTYSNMPNIMDKSYGVTGVGTMEIGHLGGLYSLNYMITTHENLRIGFLAGRMDHVTRPALEYLAELRPNVLLRQIPVILPENPAEIFANEIMKIGAQLMLPMHHESFDIGRPEFLKDMFAEINGRMAANAYSGQAFLPVRGKWYQVMTSIASLG